MKAVKVEDGVLMRVAQDAHDIRAMRVDAAFLKHEALLDFPTIEDVEADI